MQVTYKEELAPVSFIAGDYQEFEYTITDINTGRAVDPRLIKSFEVVLFRYGETETPALVVQGTRRPEFLGGGNVFTIALRSEDTAKLESGLYIQQPIIKDDEKTFRPCQGTINIIARGKTGEEDI